MKLSTKCRYGVRAMIEIASHFGEGAVKRKTITASQGISHGYLENILIALKSHQLIRTARGVNGGFVLEKKPSQVRLLEIVNALEGSIAPVDCVENASACERAGRCPARTAWKKLYDAQNKVLSGITLQDLLDLDEKQQNTPDYAI
jgi:Rrf2 family transcriptional regulator, cysteine metabolism repressor